MVRACRPIPRRPAVFLDEGYGVLSDEEIRKRIASEAFAPLMGGVFTPEHTKRMTSGGLHVFAFLVLMQNRNARPAGLAPVSGRQIARFLGLALSTVQRALERLEREGYLERHEGGGWLIRKARIGNGRRAAVTSNRDHSDLESRSPAPEGVTSNRDQGDLESRSGVTSNRDQGRSRIDVTVTSNRGHDPRQPRIPATGYSGGDGETVETKEDGETCTADERPRRDNPFGFVVYWQDANERRDFDVRFEPTDGLEEFVLAEAAELGMTRTRNELARVTQASIKRFIADYSKRDRAGTTRGKRTGPRRLTEELVAWLRKDIASEARRDASRRPSSSGPPRLMAEPEYDRPAAAECDVDHESKFVEGHGVRYCPKRCGWFIRTNHPTAQVLT